MSFTFDEGSRVNNLLPKAVIIKHSCASQGKCGTPLESFDVACVEWTHPAYPEHTKLFVCVHGLSRNARDFDLLAQRIVASVPGSLVVCIDMPGRGKSNWLAHKQSYNYGTYQLVADQIIAHYSKNKTVHWIGISMGGILGMLMASRPSSPIQRLVLVDVGPFIPRQDLERIGSYVGKEGFFDSVQDYCSLLKKNHAQFGSLSEAQWMFIAETSSRQVIGAGGVTKWKPHYDPDISIPFQGTLNDMNLWTQWDQIKCPVLVLRGGQSTLLLASTLAEMKTRGPPVQSVEFDDCGHTPQFLENGAKVESVVKFLAS